MKRNLIVLTILLLAAGAAGFLSMQEPLASGSLALPDALARLDAVISFHSKKLISDPYSFQDARLLGASYAERGRLSGSTEDYSKAQEAYRRSVAIQSKGNAKGIVGLANALQSMHRFKDADSVLSAHWGIINDLPMAWSVAGDIAFERGHYERADSLFNGYALADPGLASWSRQAKMALLGGNWKKAKTLWERICALPETDEPEQMAWAWVMHGELYLRAGMIEKARECFRTSNNLLPGYALALEHLAETYEIEGEFGKAIPLLDSAIVVTSHADLLFRRADLADWENKRAIADSLRSTGLAELEEEIANGDIGHRRVLIDLLLDQQGRKAEALTLAEAEFAERADIGAEITLARALAANGRIADAERHARAAVRFKSYEPTIMIEAAQIIRQAGHHADASELEELAYRLNSRLRTASS